MGISKPDEMMADSLLEGYAGGAKGPIVVVVRDGWGINKYTNKEAQEFNAVYQASQLARARGIKFNDDELTATVPHTELWAHGEYVGHPAYQMGDSENGHLNLGAGRQAKSTLSILDEMLKTGEFVGSPVVHKAIDNAKKGHTLHLIGMISEGGVHSHLQHLLKLLELINKNREGIKKVVLHPIFDGRDIETSERPGWQDLQVFFAKVNELGLEDIVKIGIIAGRYYPMDRDALNRDKKGEPSKDLWDERVKPWYDAIVYGKGRRLRDAPDEGVSQTDTSPNTTQKAITEETLRRGEQQPRDERGRFGKKPGKSPEDATEKGRRVPNPNRPPSARADTPKSDMQTRVMERQSKKESPATQERTLI
ncbi:MAG: hypothetical protein Q8R48_03265, partial [Candidatus Omnitrophota bacterium]|nr:hypothetical protein [Candidatus Omnitrophota bacterium]